MRGGHTPVGTRHVRVCEVEDSDETPVEKISWCQVVHVPMKADLWDRRPIYCNNITRDSGSREEGSGDSTVVRELQRRVVSEYEEY